MGVNPIKQMVSIRFDNGQADTYDISRVSVGKGCLYGYCVGDRATVQWLSGRIVGINPASEKISIYFDNGQQDTYSIDRVSIGKGCIQGYCVDDRATIEWLSGKIIGVNPRTNKVSVYFDNGQQDTYDIDRVSINSYCLQYPEMHQYRRLFSREDFSKAFNR